MESKAAKRLRCIGALTAALQKFPSEAAIAEPCTGAIGHLGCRVPVSNRSCVRAVIKAMQQFPDNARVAHHCALALHRFAGRETHRQTIAHQGGFNVCLATLRRWSGSVDIVEHCTAVLRKNATLVTHAELEPLVAAMKRFPANAAVAENCAAALGNLAANNDDCKVTLAQAGGVGQLVSAMERFADNAQAP
eukprot:TRINITY_DN5966_c0_g1_i1.p2 TRINITY_DN5966_c0_g1~~TRINITY_DN5966_c0_g1_i1.p2  ORF type:complete len:192 (-),score=29.76 TRINITY_DN5966_c0_g1_i1:234-809(-)